MDNQRILSSVLPAVAVLAFLSIIIAFAPPSPTGDVTTYRELPLTGGVRERPDPNVQYMKIDLGLCYLYVTRPATFYTNIDHLCQESNHGRQKSEAMCRRQAELDAQGKCITGPWRPGSLTGRAADELTGDVTGMVAVDSLRCANLADDYDIAVQQMLTEEPLKQTVAMVNPCTGVAEVATREGFSPEAPLKQYVRAEFKSGDVSGSVTGGEGQTGDIHYVRCMNGESRVTVSGVAVCNMLSYSNLH